MDFTKFVSLLENSSLYFTRSDKFDDPFEGSMPYSNIVERRKLMGDILSDHYSRVFKDIKRHMAINCWHVNQSESAAMWKLYLKSNEGIAVRSTVKRFKNAISDTRTVHLGMVNYIDYRFEVINPGSIYYPYLFKRKSFEHEREVRAVTMEIPYSGNPLDPATPIDYSLETILHGVEVKVNLTELIESVYVSPDSPDWLSDLIKSVTKRYGYDFDIVHSEMNRSPFF